jgi:3-dehydroquinate dehydratase
MTFQVTRFCLPIIGPTWEDIRKQFALANDLADLLELRLDLWDDVSVEALRTLRSEFRVPWMLTLRSVSQGGRFAGSKDQQMARLCALGTLSPEFIDTISSRHRRICPL